MSYSCFKEMTRHPCFGLHAHRSIVLTMLNIISLKALIPENVETWYVESSGIHTYQNGEPLPLLRYNGVDAPNAGFCQNPSTTISSRLCNGLITIPYVTSLITLRKQALQILIKSRNMVWIQTFCAPRIQALRSPQRDFGVPLPKPTQPSRPRNAFLEWCLPQLRNLRHFNFQLRDTNGMAIPSHAHYVLHNFLILESSPTDSIGFLPLFLDNVKPITCPLNVLLGMS
jgi:hypothetical protein